MPEVGRGLRRGALLTLSCVVVAGCGGEPSQSKAASSNIRNVDGWPGLVGTPKLYYYDARPNVRTAGYVLIVRLKRELAKGVGSFHVDKGAYGVRPKVWGDATSDEGIEKNVCYVVNADNEGDAKPPRFPKFSAEHRYEVSYSKGRSSTGAIARVRAVRLTRKDGTNLPDTDVKALPGPPGCKQGE